MAIVVVSPFTDTRCSEPSDEDDVVLGKLMLVNLEMDDKAETVPLELLRTTLTIGKSTDRITYSPRSGEWRREMREGAGVLADDLGSRLPVVKSKPESNLFLESDVSEKDRTVESSRPRLGKRQSLDVDIGMGVGGIGEWSRMIRIDGWE